MNIKRPQALLLLIGLQCFAVGSNASSIQVSAAASLTDVLAELVEEFEGLHTDIDVKPSYAGTSALAKQIENGAPADIFISADKDWMDYLQKRNLIDAGTRKDLLGNHLVFITPVNREFSINFSQTHNLAANLTGRICTGEPAYVPVGKYARQALEFYGWWKTLEPRLVGTEDVRTALAFVERGECELGIVYETDAKMSKKVKLVARFPEGSHLPIVYPVALTKKANNDAQKFLDYLESAQAAEVFNRYGFIVK